MKRFCLLGVLLTILMILIAACDRTATIGSQTVVDDDHNAVHMNDTNFVQPSVTIKKGGSITLIDDVAATHIIENGRWDPQTGVQRPKIEPNAPKVNDIEIAGSGSQHTIGPFNAAGTFHLYCTVHPGMNLTVIVQ